MLMLLYHAIHNGFLYALTDIAIVNAWVAESTGLNFELWSFWVDWMRCVTLILAVVTATFWQLWVTAATWQAIFWDTGCDVP